MPQPAFGFMLQKLREKRGLSLRELAQIAKLDHAYIYRLETGEKESPSEEALDKLIRALKPGKRDAEMLRYLAEYTRTDIGLVGYVFENEDVEFEIFASAAAAAFRGRTRPDPAQLIARIRRIIQEEEGDG